MNIYRMIGNNFGTAGAIELAERLSAWHDSMVAHERFGGGRPCGDDCPHGDAGLLWAEAVETYGERADELVFLRSRGHKARRPGGSPRRPDGEARA